MHDIELFDTIKLKKQHFYIKSEIPECILRNTQYSEIRSHTVDSMLVRLHYDVLGKNEVEFEESFPVTWWDAFKQRWFPKKLLKRYPANIRHVKIEKFVTFPDLQIPENCGCIVMFRTKSDYTSSYGSREGHE